jgi:hypothetical protein
VTEVKACTRLLSQICLLPHPVGALDDWAAKACTDDFVLNEFRRIHLEASIAPPEN